MFLSLKLATLEESDTCKGATFVKVLPSCTWDVCLGASFVKVQSRQYPLQRRIFEWNQTRITLHKLTLLNAQVGLEEKSRKLYQILNEILAYHSISLKT